MRKRNQSRRRPRDSAAQAALPAQNASPGPEQIEILENEETLRITADVYNYLVSNVFMPSKH